MITLILDLKLTDVRQSDVSLPSHLRKLDINININGFLYARASKINRLKIES